MLGMSMCIKPCQWTDEYTAVARCDNANCNSTLTNLTSLFSTKLGPFCGHPNQPVHFTLLSPEGGSYMLPTPPPPNRQPTEVGQAQQTTTLYQTQPHSQAKTGRQGGPGNEVIQKLLLIPMLAFVREEERNLGTRLSSLHSVDSANQNPTFTT